MEIRRDRCLDRLIKRKRNGSVKVVTVGIRVPSGQERLDL
jgi:hypothetical protein